MSVWLRLGRGDRLQQWGREPSLTVVLLCQDLWTQTQEQRTCLSQSPAVTPTTPRAMNTGAKSAKGVGLAIQAFLHNHSLAWSKLCPMVTKPKEENPHSNLKPCSELP